MSEHRAEVAWQRGSAAFIDNKYSRAHQWSFDGGAVVRASSSPDVVPLPMSDPTGVDPEEAFVAALASCHMLWFLSLAAKRGWLIDSYRDSATGVMSRDTAGKLMISVVTLRPAITFADDAQSTRDEVNAMHHEAHAQCFLANSVKTEVRCEPVWPTE